MSYKIMVSLIETPKIFLALRNAIYEIENKYKTVNKEELISLIYQHLGVQIEVRPTMTDYRTYQVTFESESNFSWFMLKYYTEKA